MQRGFLAKYLCVTAMMAVPALAGFATTSSSTSPIAWYDPLTNFTVLTFDGAGNQSCIGSSSCSVLLLSGVQFYGFLGSPSSTNSVLQLISENDQYYNYGGAGQPGNPRILMGDAAANSTTPIGFRIVLPSAVTSFGVQIMGSVGSYNVAVKLIGSAISDPGGAYPAGTLATASAHGRTFFGVTSTTPFTTVDIIGSPGISGEFLVIDNLAFGTAAAPASDTVEPQTAVFILSGLGMMLLARKMRIRRQAKVAIA